MILYFSVCSYLLLSLAVSELNSIIIIHLKNCICTISYDIRLATEHGDMVVVFGIKHAERRVCKLISTLFSLLNSLYPLKL